MSDADLAECFEKIGAILDHMESDLADAGPWLLGAFTLADIAVAPYLFRLSALGSERFWSDTLRPNVARWYSRILARDAFQTAASWPDETGEGYAEVGLREAKGDLGPT